MNTNLVSSSKFLSLLLRHKPEEIGLTLDAEGWAAIDELILLTAQAGRSFTRALIEEIVAKNDKRRFVISDDGLRIRANQGHSIDVDLRLEPQEPPLMLFHGTATRFLDSIQASGLIRGKRQHVHLSADQVTATKVGQRHGQPVVLVVSARAMHSAGHAFFLSANGVWLTEHVPPSFLKVGQ